LYLQYKQVQIPVSYPAMDAFGIKIPALPLFHIPGQTGNLAGYRTPEKFSKSLPNETHSTALSIPSRGRPKRKTTEDQDSPMKKICENSRRATIIPSRQAELIGSPPEPLSPSKRLNREVRAGSRHSFEPIESE
jgi:hypothetical protein